MLGDSRALKATKPAMLGALPSFPHAPCPCACAICFPRYASAPTPGINPHAAIPPPPPQPPPPRKPQIFVISRQRIQQRGYDTLFKYATKSRRSLFGAVVLRFPPSLQVGQRGTAGWVWVRGAGGCVGGWGVGVGGGHGLQCMVQRVGAEHTVSLSTATLPLHPAVPPVSRLLSRG